MSASSVDEVLAGIFAQDAATHFSESDLHEISSHDLFLGLLDYGLFAEKLPPCFVSVGLAQHVKNQYGHYLSIADDRELKEKLSVRRDYIRYEALRDINIPRNLGVPHPEAYGLQALALEKHWYAIDDYCAKPCPRLSRIYARHTGGGKIFEMSYKGDDRYENEENDLKSLIQAKFLVHADISSCFPSIYTHAIPWALHGQQVSKKNGESFILYGNLLDVTTRHMRDAQTNGILIGPHSSNIISEIILTAIDLQMQRRGYKYYKRHIDDYDYAAKDYDDACKFIRDLSLSLRDFGLALNEKKTRITSLPQASQESWVRQLNSHTFPSGELRYSDVRIFLDLALELAQHEGKSSPINYAFQMIPNRLNMRAKRMLTYEAISLALAYPYLAPQMETDIFERFRCDFTNGAIADFCKRLVIIGHDKVYPDAVAHSLYYALRYNIRLPEVEAFFENIIGFDDCITNVLLLEYAGRFANKKIAKKIKERSFALKGLDSREIDRQWLLAYQTWSFSDLNGNKQPFLAVLKQSGFSFLRSWPVFAAAS